MEERQDQLLTAQEVWSLLRISEPTLYLWIRQGKFPPAFKIGRQAARWRQSVVRQWICDREAGIVAGAGAVEGVEQESESPVGV